MYRKTINRIGSLLLAVTFVLMSVVGVSALPSIEIPNAHFITNKQYEDANLQLIRNSKVADLRDIAEITVNSPGIESSTRVVWYQNNPEKTVDIKASAKSGDAHGVCYSAINPYQVKFKGMYKDRLSMRTVDLIVKCTRISQSSTGIAKYQDMDSSLLSIDGENIWLNGLKGRSDTGIALEYRYTDTGELYDKDTMICFVDLDSNGENIKMGESFDGNYYVPGITKGDWWLRKGADGYIGNSYSTADNDTFKTGFACYVHNGTISFDARVQDDAGFGIGSNGIQSNWGSLKVIKESNN